MSASASGSSSEPQQQFSNEEIAQIHFVYGACNGDAQEALEEYKKRYPQRVTPSAELFTDIHQRLLDSGVPNERGKPRYTKLQAADMHFVYGYCNGNLNDASCEYKRRFPRRKQPDSCGFIDIHERISKYGAKEFVFPTLSEREKAKQRAFFKKAYKNSYYRSALLGLGMHPLIMSEIFKKGEPNIPFLKTLKSIKDQGMRLSFTEVDCEGMLDDNDSDDDDSVASFETEVDLDFSFSEDELTEDE